MQVVSDECNDETSFTKPEITQQEAETLESDTIMQDTPMATEEAVIIAPLSNVRSEVNTNLRSLVFGDPTDQTDKPTFSLFAPSTTLLQPDNLDFLIKEDTEEPYDPVTDTRREASDLFLKTHNFFMDGNDKGSSKSLYKPTYSFMLTESLEDVKYEWERNKRELTDEFKRKHKSALKKKMKSQRYPSGKM